MDIGKIPLRRFEIFAVVIGLSGTDLIGANPRDAETVAGESYPPSRTCPLLRGILREIGLKLDGHHHAHMWMRHRHPDFDIVELAATASQMKTAIAVSG